MKTNHQIIVLALAISTFGPLAASAQPVKGWGSGANGTGILKDLTGTQNPASDVSTGGINGSAGYAIGSQAKRGWSPQATGTTIGAGAGAAAGAIINKRNRVVGGVIGGVVGGAAGYAIGKNKDNKNKAEAARVAAAERAAAQKAAAEKAAADRAAAEKADNERMAAEKVATDRATAERVAAAKQEEREKAVAYRTTPARPEPRQTQPTPAASTMPRPSVAVPSTEGMHGVSLTESAEKPMAYVLKSGFLINDTYGDPQSAYPTSEYRRKSW